MAPVTPPALAFALALTPSDWTSIAVIAARRWAERLAGLDGAGDGRVQVIDPLSTKGLEWDATVVVDPQGIVEESPGGVRVLTETMPGTRSVTVGGWVGVGSRDESSGHHGSTHFLEHLLFKGTENHSAIEISELFDGMGAASNAATGKETTHLHARFLDEHGHWPDEPPPADRRGPAAPPPP